MDVCNAYGIVFKHVDGGSTPTISNVSRTRKELRKTIQVPKHELTNVGRVISQVVVIHTDQVFIQGMDSTGKLRMVDY